MGRMHHEKGCLNCGKLRRLEDIFNMTYDIMLKDSVSGTLIRVGLCQACYEAGNHDLDDLKTKLAESEEVFAAKKSQPLANVYKEARFVGVMNRNDYWKAVNEKFPDGPKKTSDYLEVISDARK